MIPCSKYSYSATYVKMICAMLFEDCLYIHLYIYINITNILVYLYIYTYYIYIHIPIAISMASQIPSSSQGRWPADARQPGGLRRRPRGGPDGGAGRAGKSGVDLATAPVYIYIYVHIYMYIHIYILCIYTYYVYIYTYVSMYISRCV